MSFLTIVAQTDPNTFFGYLAGSSAQINQNALQGVENTLIGYRAGELITTGSDNVALGHYALNNADATVRNVAIGSSALRTNNQGNDNIAIGADALLFNVFGPQNVAIGTEAQRARTDGQDNIAIGFRALRSNTTGDSNIAIGCRTLFTTSGRQNVFVGSGAGEQLTTGERNAAFGHLAGGLITTGNKNSILGSYSGNQGGLDIRTLSNYIVLSDGDGNPRLWIDNTGAASIPGGITLSGGTANGVLFLNGSKVVTSGSALTFDGSLQLTASVDGTNGIFRVSDTAASTRLQMYSDSTRSYFGVIENKPLVFLISNSEQMRLNSTGLGIGTSNPGRKLDVVDANRLASGEIGSFGAGATATQQIRMGYDTTGPLGWIQSANFGSAVTPLVLNPIGGSVGIRTSPSAWGSTWAALQVTAWGSISAEVSTTGEFSVNWNTYASTASVFRYIGNAAASRYRQLGGAHEWYSAGAGTGGNIITFTQAMTLDASGNLAIGTTNALGARLRVVGASGGASILVSASNSTSQPAFGIQGGFPGFYDDGGLITYGGGVRAWFSSTFTSFLDNSVRVGRNLEGYNASANAIDFGTSSTQDFIFQTTGARILHRTNQNNSIVFITNGTQRLEITGGGNIVPGGGALATNATDGFIYVAGCAGTPTGTPTAATGRVPIVVDTTNNKLYFYSGGAWRDAGP